MRYLFLFTSLLVSLPSFFNSYAFAAPKEQEQLITTLHNGLKVAIIRDPLAPVVQVMVNYHVGSAECPTNQSGNAHALEHMMFNGTKNLSRDQLAVLSARLGGMNNADTTADMTQYYFEIPASDLKTVLHIESDRMHDLNISAKEWAHERGAIEQEVSRDLSDPIYRYSMQLRAILFHGTPYEHDALGTREAFDKTSSNDLRHFYKQWYAPNNAVIVIAGDINPKQTLSLVESQFSSIPSHTLPERPKLSLPPVTAQTMHLKTDLPISLVAFGWRWPGLTSNDYAAATILSDLINNDRGPIGSLAPEGKALEAGLSYEPEELGGTAIAYIGFPKSQNPEKYTELLRLSLDKVASGNFSKADIKNAKEHEISSLSFSQNSISGLAEIWSTTLVTQGLNNPNDLIQSFKKVGKQDLQRLARSLLDSSNMITAVLTPSGKIAAVGARANGAPESLSKAPTTVTQLPPWAQQEIGKPVLPPKRNTPAVFTLKNGLKVIVQTEHVSPTIELVGSIKENPYLVEPKGKEGTSDLLNQMFIYGSKKHNRIELSKLLDDLAADEQAGSEFSLSVLKSNFKKSLKLLAEHELNPAFPGENFKVARQQFAQEQAGIINSPRYHLSRAFKQALLPKNDPTARKTTPESISAVSLSDLDNFFKKNYRPDMTTIFIIGDIKPTDAKKAIEKYFGKWHAEGNKPPFLLPKVPSNHYSKSFVSDPGRSQDETHLSEMIPSSISDPQHFSLSVGNEVLGIGFSSRLMKELRVQTGYAYNAGSSFNFSQTRSSFTINFGTDPDKLTKAVAKATAILEDLRIHPIYASEIEIAKGGLLRRQVLSQASFSSLAHNYLWIDEMGLPINYSDFAAQKIFETTPQMIQAAFKNLISLKNLAQITYGPKP